MNELQIVVFSLKGQLFGADATQIYHIVNSNDIKQVSGMPDFVEGTIEIQESEVPVINLSRRFGLNGQKEVTGTKILLIKVENMQIGFMVDAVTEILHLSAEEIVSLPVLMQPLAPKCLGRVVKKDNLLFSLIDLSKVLTDLEIENVNSII